MSPENTSYYYRSSSVPYYDWNEHIRALKKENEELREKLELIEKETGKKVIKRSPYEVVDGKTKKQK